MIDLDTVNYEDLRDALSRLPMTWYPDLTRAIIEGGYANNVWQDHGASRFVQQVEAEIAVKPKDGF